MLRAWNCCTFQSEPYKLQFLEFEMREGTTYQKKNQSNLTYIKIYSHGNLYRHDQRLVVAVVNLHSGGEEAKFYDQRYPKVNIGTCGNCTNSC